ncbi:MAG: hypothetical protein ABI905_12475 [Betaproteobacteria bacterium]
MTRRHIALFICLVIAAAPLIWMSVDSGAGELLLSISRTPLQKLNAASRTEAANVVNSYPAQPTATASDSLRTVAMPPINEPLGQTFSAYKALAAQGNALAGCRLARQLNECRKIATAQKQIEALQWLLNLRKPGDKDYEELVKRKADIEQGLSPLDTFCTGVEPAEFGNAWRYLLDAAQTGHVQSMVLYATSPPLDEQQFMRDFEAWKIYREMAPVLLERAALTGDMRAIEWLRAELTGQWPFNGGPIMQRNPERVVALTMVLAKLPKTNFVQGVDRRVLDMQKEIGVAGMERAKTYADTFFQQAFPRGPPPEPPENSGDASATTSSGTNTQNENDCDAPVDLLHKKYL